MVFFEVTGMLFWIGVFSLILGQLFYYGIIFFIKKAGELNTFYTAFREYLKYKKKEKDND